MEKSGGLALIVGSSTRLSKKIGHKVGFSRVQPNFCRLLFSKFLIRTESIKNFVNFEKNQDDVSNLSEKNYSLYQSVPSKIPVVILDDMSTRRLRASLVSATHAGAVVNAAIQFVGVEEAIQAADATLRTAVRHYHH